MANPARRRRPRQFSLPELHTDPELIQRLALLRCAAVVRFRICLLIFLALSAIIGTVLCAQISDEEQRKREIFLKTRTSHSSNADESPAPKRHSKKKSSTTEKHSTSSKKKSSVTPKPKTSKHKASTKKGSSSKKGRRKKSARPEKTPVPKKEKEPAATTPSPPAEHPTPSIPRAIPIPSPQERAQVVVEKSGFDGDQGFVPPPEPPPRRFRFWPWSRQSRAPSYRYLTRSVVEEIRRAPVQRRRWQFIVVHNSGTRQGNARVFDYYHRHVRRMRNGLAYHFVIGNGTSTGDGEIEVGDRWRRQINGGHVHSDYLNNISLGICLVGDFNRDQPSRAQLECCEELIRYLRQRCGKVDDHDILVRPHREMNPPRWPTDCPGDRFPYSWFRRFR